MANEINKDDDFFDEDSEMFQDFVPDKPLDSSGVEKAEKADGLQQAMQRAPTVVIESFTVGKPLKVLCLLLMLLTLLLFSISLLSVSWMRTTNMRMGLFQECLLVNPNPESDAVSLCESNVCVTWEFRSLAITAVSSAGLTLFDFILLSVAMVTIKPRAKKYLYRLVIILNILAACGEIVVCVMYPLLFIGKFSANQSLTESQHSQHGNDIQIGYCLVAGSSGAGLLLLGTLLLCIDRTEDEVFYREKIIRDCDEEYEE